MNLRPKLGQLEFLPQGIWSQNSKSLVSFFMAEDLSKSIIESTQCLEWCGHWPFRMMLYNYDCKPRYTTMVWEPLDMPFVVPVVAGS